MCSEKSAFHKRQQRRMRKINANIMKSLQISTNVSGKIVRRGVLYFNCRVSHVSGQHMKNEKKRWKNEKSNATTRTMARRHVRPSHARNNKRRIEWLNSKRWVTHTHTHQPKHFHKHQVQTLTLVYWLFLLNCDQPNFIEQIIYDDRTMKCNETHPVPVQTFYGKPMNTKNREKNIENLSFSSSFVFHSVMLFVMLCVCVCFGMNRIWIFSRFAKKLSHSSDLIDLISGTRNRRMRWSERELFRPNEFSKSMFCHFALFSMLLPNIGYVNEW